LAADSEDDSDRRRWHSVWRVASADCNEKRY
jgi:hypothetical protein